MRIEIVDLGQNNLSSVERAIRGKMRESDYCISISEPEKSNSPDLIVLPGLGHFKSGMESLKRKRFDEFLMQENSKNTRMVGICLGMQLFCLESEEAPGISGLGIIPGIVKILPEGEPRPNIGWGELEVTPNAHEFPSLVSNRDFYFVHSYHVELIESEDILTRTRFSSSFFVSSYKIENILGFQFHPEKSGDVGQQLIAEIVDWAR